MRALLRTLLALAVGGGLQLAGRPGAATVVWTLGTAVVLAGLLVDTVRALRQRRTTVDVIALLAMGGAIAAGEALAGIIIAVMLTGGRSLESMAGDRAEKELHVLIARAPRTAHRLADDRLTDVDVAAVQVGDVLVVRPGEVVPVDGVLTQDGLFDESSLTGESVPVTLDRGARARSGITNVGTEVHMTAVATVEDSTYTGIVRLVERARTARAPMVRLADRWAGWFVPLTLVLSAAAWAWSGDPVRALAVLVVATPCPLLLATPIAIVSGISRAATRGVIVKDGGALELLAASRTVCLDKTGTLTTGRPTVVAIHALVEGDPAPHVRLAAAVEQLSTHPFGPAVVAAAGGDPLPLPSGVEEVPGEGVRGQVEGRAVTVGSRGLVADGSGPSAAARRVAEAARAVGRSVVWVGVDGTVVAALVVEDPLRVDARTAVRGLRAQGVDRIVLLSGDRRDVAQRMGDAVGVDVVLAEQTPEQKVAVVLAEHGRATTVMVGDGVNDAPALAAADVGVAMGARGATASSEAAAVVITVDRLDRLTEARLIAARTRRIATQSAQLGMALSGVAMLAAAAGLLQPVAGALLQEGIDVLAILNALRAMRPGATAR